jgi:hypothetical protein
MPCGVMPQQVSITPAVEQAETCQRFGEYAAERFGCVAFAATRGAPAWEWGFRAR